jgi:hypothetical protein
MSDDIKKELVLRYVDEGPYMGHKRTFNEYDICIITGKTKVNILQKKFNEKMIKDFLKKIRSIQDIPMSIDVNPNLRNNTEIQNRINEFVQSNHELQNDAFLTKFLSGLYKSWDEGKSKQIIYQHWVLLNNQISAEIDYINDNLHHMPNSKMIKELLEQIGIYRKIYQERFDKVGREVANNERLKIKESNIKKYINTYMRTNISRLKNQHMEAIEDMGEQWKFLLNFKDQGKLFNKIYKKFTGHVQNVNILMGIIDSHFSYEESSSFLHYIFVKAVASIFNLHAEGNKLAKGMIQEESDEVQSSSDLSSSSAESSSTNFIKGIRFKQTEESQTIVNFVHGMLNKIRIDQNQFNELTQAEIHKNVEWQRRRNLKLHLKLFQVMEEQGKREDKAIAKAKIAINGYHRNQLEKIYNVFTGEEDNEDKQYIDQNQEQHVIEDQVREQQLEREAIMEEQDYMGQDEDEYDDFDVL